MVKRQCGQIKRARTSSGSSAGNWRSPSVTICRNADSKNLGVFSADLCVCHLAFLLVDEPVLVAAS